ncbi:MAG TPA: hypothetical protein VHU17_20745 [Acidimicrobiales bacterium]|nr:hypothetical protein [Acidimicrobiales bacterium]
MSSEDTGQFCHRAPVTSPLARPQDDVYTRGRMHVADNLSRRDLAEPSVNQVQGAKRCREARGLVRADEYRGTGILDLGQEMEQGWGRIGIQARERLIKNQQGHPGKQGL